MMVGIDAQHITLACAAQCHFDVANTIDAVSRNPLERYTESKCAPDHFYGDSRFSRKAGSFRHVSCRHPCRIVRPGFRQVKRPVDEGVAVAGHGGGKHAGLAIGDLACRTSVLTRYTAGGLALLEKSGFIDDEDGVLVSQGLHHVFANDVAQLICVPPAAPKNSLLAPWTRIARCLRSHPAGLTALRSKQTVKKMPRRSRYTLLYKQGPHPRFHVPQRQRPELKRCLDRCPRHSSPPDHDGTS